MSKPKEAKAKEVPMRVPRTDNDGLSRAMATGGRETKVPLKKPYRAEKTMSGAGLSMGIQQKARMPATAAVGHIMFREPVFSAKMLLFEHQREGLTENVGEGDKENSRYNPTKYTRGIEDRKKLEAQTIRRDLFLYSVDLHEEHGHVQAAEAEKHGDGE